MKAQTSLSPLSCWRRAAPSNFFFPPLSEIASKIPFLPLSSSSDFSSPLQRKDFFSFFSPPFSYTVRKELRFLSPFSFSPLLLIADREGQGSPLFFFYFGAPARRVHTDSPFSPKKRGAEGLISLPFLPLLPRIFFFLFRGAEGRSRASLFPPLRQGLRKNLLSTFLYELKRGRKALFFLLWRSIARDYDNGPPLSHLLYFLLTIRLFSYFLRASAPIFFLSGQTWRGR